jgi:hypothetical protein
MKLRMTFCLGVLLAVAICAGYLASLFQQTGLRGAVVQYPVLAESQPPKPMTLQYAESQRTSLTTISSIMADPNFRVVLRALEQRRGTQTLAEPEVIITHSVGPANFWYQVGPFSVVFANGLPDDHDRIILN